MVPVPMGVPLKKSIEKCDILTTIKKGLSVGANHLPYTSSSTPRMVLLDNFLLIGWRGSELLWSMFELCHQDNQFLLCTLLLIVN